MPPTNSATPSSRPTCEVWSNVSGQAQQTAAATIRAIIIWLPAQPPQSRVDVGGAPLVTFHCNDRPPIFVKLQHSTPHLHSRNA